MSLSEEDFSRLAREAALRNQQTEVDPWQDSPTEIQGHPQPRVQPQAQSQAIAHPPIVQPSTQSAREQLEQRKVALQEDRRKSQGGSSNLVSLGFIGLSVAGIAIAAWNNFGSKPQIQPAAQVPEQVANPTPVPTPTPLPPFAPNTPATQPAPPSVDVNYPIAISRCNGQEADANLRESPGGAIASVLYFSTPFRIVLQQGEWSLIESADGRKGFINQCFIQGAVPVVPRVSSPPAPVVVPNHQSI